MATIKLDGFKLLALAALATRIYALSATKGFLHPDNLYQIVEPAHIRVFGYGIVPWEFVYGIRSWLQPLLVSMVFKLGMAFGITGIEQLIFLSRCLMILASLALLYVVYETGLTLYNRTVGLYSLFFAVFSGMLWLWSADVNAHIPSTLYTTAALLLFYGGWREGSGRHYFISGLALGVAFMFRFDSLLFIIPLSLFTVWSRRFVKTGYFASGLILALLLQGVLDYLTWGSFMHSPLAFIDHNLLQNKSSIFGRAPMFFYLLVLCIHMPCLFLLTYAVEKRDETGFLLLNAAAFFIAYSLVAHKEMRFMMPVLPLFFVLAGRGLERAVEMYGRAILYGMAALTVALSLVLLAGFQWQAQYGFSEGIRYVGRQPDATGVAYTRSWFHNGVYTSLHKPIPAVGIGVKALSPRLENVTCGRPDPELIEFQCSPLKDIIAEPRINYVVTEDGNVGLTLTSNGFSKVMEFDGTTVYRRIGR